MGFEQMTPAEAVARLEGIDPRGDPEGAHGEADKILLAALPSEVRDAYRSVMERAPWWASA